MVVLAREQRGGRYHRDLLAEQDAKFKNKKNKAHKETAGGG